MPLFRFVGDQPHVFAAFTTDHGTLVLEPGQVADLDVDPGSPLLEAAKGATADVTARLADSRRQPAEPAEEAEAGWAVADTDEKAATGTKGRTSKKEN